MSFVSPSTFSFLALLSCEQPSFTLISLFRHRRYTFLWMSLFSTFDWKQPPLVLCFCFSCHWIEKYGKEWQYCRRRHHHHFYLSFQFSAYFFFISHLSSFLRCYYYYQEKIQQHQELGMTTRLQTNRKERGFQFWYLFYWRQEKHKVKNTTWWREDDGEQKSNIALCLHCSNDCLVRRERNSQHQKKVRERGLNEWLWKLLSNFISSQFFLHSLIIARFGSGDGMRNDF